MSTLATTSYTLTDVGTLPGGSSSLARGINAAGSVSGTADTPGGEFHAFLFHDGLMQDLGTLGGRTSLATAVNDAGQVIGQSERADGALHAFLWAGGRMADLGALSGRNSALHSFSRGASDSSLPAVGSAEIAGGVHALLYTNNGLLDLDGPLGGRGRSFASGINAAGALVGGARTATGVTHAFQLIPGRMQDLGTLGGQNSSATAISAAGHVIGNAETTAGAVHAFLWPGSGPLQDLGTLGGRNSFAAAINSSGQIVGRSGSAGGVTHAFVYDGSMRDLNNLVPAGSGWDLVDATGINDSGQIVGFGRLGGKMRAFLLTPSQG
jgi:probable HAF family extracellular repeat protein